MNKIKGYINEYLLLVIFASFMMAVFALFEIYFSNKDYFFFDGTEMIAFSALAFAFMFCLLALFLFVTYLCSEKTCAIVAAIGFGIAMALYIQGNFLKNDYGVLDGNQIKWEEYCLDGFISVSMFILLIVVMIIVERKVEREKFLKIIRYGSIYIILIQLITLTTLFISKNGLKKDDVYLSTTYGETEYSSDENFVILMLDTYESTTLTKILNEDDSGIYHDCLEDFIYYPDTSGMYRSTVLALPHLFSGVEYHNDCTLEEYFTKTYEQSALLQELQNKNWFIGIYNQNRIPNSEIATIAENCKRTRLTVSSHRRLAEYMYKLVAYRYMPQPLKRFFWFYADDIETSLKESKDHYDIYCHNNFIFNDSLNTVSNNSDRKTFHFIELAGAHPPYDVTADFRMDAENASKISTGQGLLVMLENYKNALKEKGAYDNTTIIVLGDHGKELLWNPVFMIKPANARHKLIVDDTPFSYQTLQELYLEIISGAGEEGIRGIISTHKDMRRRYLRYESGDGKNEEDYFGSDIVECEVVGRADREGAIIPTDIVYFEHRR
ncbi:MAG: hypothetical protein K5868_02360 [Lachnospiraceae bacterium]|nr:hypothetical protein [Lachnospiraceae bacterium]